MFLMHPKAPCQLYVVMLRNSAGAYKHIADVEEHIIESTKTDYANTYGLRKGTEFVVTPRYAKHNLQEN